MFACKAHSISFVCFLFFSLFAAAQQPVNDSASGKKQIYIINSLRLNYEKKDSSEFQSAVGNVVIRQDKTLFYSDSVVLNKNRNVLEAFGHVHINDADSVQTYADYLRYVGNERKAYLKKNVRLTDGKGTLITPELEYDINSKIGTYTKGGKVLNGKTVLNSEEGYYYGETRDVYFKKKVVLVSPDYNIKTDTLLYNTYTDIATFVAPTEITSGKNRKILTSEGYYDLKSKKAYFSSRPQIQDSTTFLVADEVASDDSTGFGEARGNVIYRDTAQGLTLLSNNLKNNNKNESFLATQSPVMILKQDEDSIYIAADTFYSAKLSELLKKRIVPVISDTSTQQENIIPHRTNLLNNKPSNIKDSTVLQVDSTLQEMKDSVLTNQQDLTYEAPDSSYATVKDSSAKSDSSSVVVKTSIDSAKNFSDVLQQVTSVQDSAAVVTTSIDSAKTFSDVLQQITSVSDSTLSRRNKLDIILPAEDSAYTENADSIVSDQQMRMVFADSLALLQQANRKVDSSHDRFIEAYFNVRIFSDSLQAVGDSLFYSADDSAFRLFKDPIIWAQESQVTGDTIYLFTADKKPKRVYVFENALSIEKVGDNFYNQVKGRTINGWFENGNIDHLRAKGNSESVYYGQDENEKLIGVNKNSSDVIDIYFANKEAQRVVFRNNLEGTAYPMRQVNHEELRLRGFTWHDDVRPKTRYDLFAN